MSVQNLMEELLAEAKKSQASIERIESVLLDAVEKMEPKPTASELGVAFLTMSVVCAQGVGISQDFMKMSLEMCWAAQQLRAMQQPPRGADA